MDLNKTEMTSGHLSARGIRCIHIGHVGERHPEQIVLRLWLRFEDVVTDVVLHVDGEDPVHVLLRA